MRLPIIAAMLAMSISPALAAAIAPHRAVYDLSLMRSEDGASLASVSGRLAFEVQGSACEGWTVSFRMANRFVPSEGEVRTVDSQSTSFESGDALDLRYNQREFTNGALQRETRTKVSRDTIASEGKGDLGTGTEFAVPAGALFPMQHQLRLMDMAEKGEPRDSSVIYDGSDDEKLFRAITFIGKRKEPGANSRDKTNAEAASLASLPSWPVTISYFPAADAGSDVPSYQVSFDLYSNGVATGLVLDYGQFALSGNLIKFEALGGEACN